jgi:4-hydroxybenzoate polyprenyltransferase
MKLFDSVNVWFQALRVKHWVKNGLVFAALIFSKNIFNYEMLGRAAAAFFLFGFLASGIYLINDLADVREDKRHPAKCHRPIASGKIGLSYAIFASSVLVFLSVLSSFLMSFWFGVILFVYFVLNVLYSAYFKSVVIVDVFCVASGFVLRVLAGGVIIGVPVSHWLIVCTGLLALFLSFTKRRHELILLGDNASAHRKILEEYSPYFLDQMIAVVTSATLIGYILYTISEVTIQKFGTDKLIFTIPFVLYGIFRYLYLVHQKTKGGNPTELLLTDAPILVDIILWTLVSVWILYLGRSN